MAQTNPFASPASVEHPPEAESVAKIQAVQIRLANAGAERGLRQWMICLCGGYLLMGGFSLMMWTDKSVPASQQQTSLIMAFVHLTALIIAIAIGMGVWRLKAWARLPLTLLCVVSLLLLFPIGLVVSPPLLWILYARRGVRLLTPEYQLIVRDSGEPPGGRTSGMTWVGVVLLLILIISEIVIRLLPPEFRRPPQ